MKLSKAQIRNIIDDEVEVDCYEEDEITMSWYIFLSDNLGYPFEAEYLAERKNKKSIWEKVVVTGTASESEDFNTEEFYVTVEFDGLLIPARLSELRNIKADENCLRTIQVWEGRND